MLRSHIVTLRYGSSLEDFTLSGPLNQSVNQILLVQITNDSFTQRAVRSDPL